MEPTSLRSELERLRARLVRLIVGYGLARALSWTAGGLALLFLLDRALVLPAPLRLLLSCVLSVLVLFWLLRDIAALLRRGIGVEDLACAVEKRFPRFQGRLLSALELEVSTPSAERSVSPVLVEELRRKTESLVRGVDLSDIFRYRPLARISLIAIAFVFLDVGYASVRPDLASIFVRRLFGGTARWPRRVVLTVDFPEHPEHFRVERSAGGVAMGVRIAAGAALPVVVRARGEQPRFVELVTREIESGRRDALSLTPTARGEWVGRFKSVRAPFTFRARDGDPNDDGEEIEVVVVPSPTVEAVATRLEFPPYTGLEPRVEPRGDVEAPVGTRVLVRVESRGDVVSGQLDFENQGESLALERESETSWTARFTVRESTSYSVRLEGSGGFENLDRPTFAVLAVRDRAPTVRLLEPSRAHVEATPEGIVPFRVAADDDFGVAGLEIAFTATNGGDEHVVDLLGSAQERGRRRQLVYRLLDLRETTFPHGDAVRRAQVGDSFAYVVRAVDNRDVDGEEGPNRVEVSGRRVDVVSVNEMMRLLTERQIRLKDDVRALRAVQAEKLERLRELLADFDASEGDEAPPAENLSAAEIGQSQVTTRATRLCVEFAGLFERYLYNRIDRSAAAERLVPLVAERKRSATEVDAFSFSTYRSIVASYESGAFGRLDVLGRLLDMLKLALDVAEKLSPAAGEEIAQARLAPEATDRPEGLRRAAERQQEVLDALDRLLERMDEWEDFQEILTLFRDLVEDQRDINARTRAALRGER